VSARRQGAEASGEGGTAIDLELVEAGIEIGKKMMAEMIANYPAPGKSPGVATTATVPAPSAASRARPLNGPETGRLLKR
jgi:hypothetical protein